MSRSSLTQNPSPLNLLQRNKFSAHYERIYKETDSFLASGQARYIRMFHTASIASGNTQFMGVDRTGQGSYGTATTMDVVSSSGNDDAGGTGATKVLIRGVDANYAEIEEEIEPTGAIAVTGTKLFRGTSEIFVVTAGSGLTNDGKITVSPNSGSNIGASLAANNYSVIPCFYHVPAGKILFIERMVISCDEGPFELYYHEISEGRKALNEPLLTAPAGSYNVPCCFFIDEKTLFETSIKNNHPTTADNATLIIDAYLIDK